MSEPNVTKRSVQTRVMVKNNLPKNIREQNIEPRKGAGRPKGVPNKNTALLKDAILLAANNAGGGGKNGVAEYLQMQAILNPGPFMSLIGKVLPMQVTGPDDGPLQITVKRYTDDDV